MAAPNLYIKGSPFRNAIFGLHVAIAGVVSLLGPLQIIPWLRRHAPQFHRVSRRVYAYSACAIGLDGIVLAWRPGAIGGKLDHLIISINALIILVCALFTIRTAKKKEMVAHNRWAPPFVIGDERRLVTPGIPVFMADDLGQTFWL